MWQNVSVEDDAVVVQSILCDGCTIKKGAIVGRGCIVGKDYPLPIVDHKIASKQNMQWMSEGYKRSKLAKGAASKPTKKATQGSGGNKKRKSAPGKSDIRGHFAQKKHL